jgi:hypothetical protein
MRIWFTLAISAPIAEADVSWNGLFIGIWTTLEVSLVFVVACTLCLPKLIQAKGRKFRVALSCASAPFSAIPNIVRRKTGQSEIEPTASQSSNKHVRNSSWEDIELDDKGPKYFESREHRRWQEEADGRSSRPSGVLNRTSSAAGGSSYSHRHVSRHSNPFEDGFQQQPLHTPELSKQQQQWRSAFSP